MNDGALALGSGMMVLLILVSIVLGVLWIILPIAVFGMKGQLDNIAAELRRTNKLLSETLKGMPPISGVGPTDSADSHASADAEKEKAEAALCPVCGKVPDRMLDIWVEGRRRRVCVHHEYNEVPSDGICPICIKKLRALHDKHEVRVMHGERLYVIRAHRTCGPQLFEAVKAGDVDQLIR
jgi:hypothetical protein